MLLCILFQIDDKNTQKKDKIHTERETRDKN